MKILDIDKDVLLRPLQAVSGIVERRHTLPILSNVMLETRGKNLNLVATDLEIQIATSAKLEKVGTDHAVTVSARNLQEILRALPESTAVALDVQKRPLQPKARQNKFNLPHPPTHH